MKKINVILLVVAMLVGSLSFAFADANFSPLSIFSKLTGMTNEEAYALKRESNKSLGELAQDAEVYEAFREEMQVAKSLHLDQLVAEGKLTREQADEMLKRMESCNGDRSQMMKSGFGFGMKNGMGGQMMARGMKKGFGQGQGFGKNFQNGLGE